jgi:hypothetical protein
MLCLDSNAKDCIAICEMIKGKRDKKPKTVYYCPVVNERHMNQVDDVHTLFKPHKEQMKSKLCVTDGDLQEGIDMLGGAHEPSDDTRPGVKKTFWHARKLKQCLLTSEMDLRGSDQTFRLQGIPKDRREWPGSFCVIGASGAGKTRWVVDMIQRHWKGATMLNRRKVIYLSSEVFIDKTLTMLTDMKKYEHLFVPVDLGIDTGIESGLSPDEFWLQKIEPKITDVRDCIIVFDDAQDSYCPARCRVAIDRGIRTGRHKNICTIALFHSIRNGQWTQQILQSAKHVCLFPRSQKGRVRDYFNTALSLTLNESRELTNLLQTTGRAAVVRLHNPVCIIAEKYLRLL